MDLAFANSLAAKALRLEHRFESTEIRIGEYRIILGQNEFSCGPVETSSDIASKNGFLLVFLNETGS
jgi:hypothetical protein